MEFAVRTEAAAGRSREMFGEVAGSPSIDPWTAEPACCDASLSSYPEIDCIRPLIAADVVEAAGRRAAALGVGADRVLIAAGELSEETYLRAFAAALGTAFEPLDGISRKFCPLDDQRLIEAAAAGLLPVTIDGKLHLVVAPRGGAPRRIWHLIEDNPARARIFRFTSAEHIKRFVLRHGGKAIAARATDKLKQTWPILSAGPPRRRMNFVPGVIAMLIMVIATAVAPTAATFIVGIALAAIFLAWVGLRLTGAFIKWRAVATPTAPPHDALPIYTIIAALYREAASVDGLLTAIECLDYPGIMAQAPQDIFRAAAI
jgi:glycosyltransferase XagB